MSERSPTTQIPNDLDAFWMPFTAQRAFSANPRMIGGAKGVHYFDTNGRRVIDGTGGLWCCNAGHGVDRIARAIQNQAAELDFAPSFNLGHPLAFQVTSRLTALADGFEHVFLTNSGSEAVDTALKIALAYHQARGEGQRRVLVGRQKAYHGVNFGGLSVSGIGLNKAQFGTLYPSALHLRHTWLSENAFSRGQPKTGAHLAEDLSGIVETHGGHSIAAVIVEPVAGAGGVYPPPQGYLERLRQICDAHGILLVFDEVITGFGRLGTPFAYTRLGVRPDLVTFAKGVTNATVPMGGVLANSQIRAAFRDGPDTLPDLFHGYTYSGHPLACAAAIATLDTYRDDGIFAHAEAMSGPWEDMLHSLRDIPGVLDIRNLGLLGAVQLESAGAPGAVGRAVFARAWDLGLMLRPIGDSLALSPPLVIDRADIAEIGKLLGEALRG